MRRASITCEKPFLAALRCVTSQHRCYQKPLIRMLHIKRPATTVEKFERPEHRYHRFRKHTQALIDGVVKSVPVTTTSLVDTLHLLCGADPTFTSSGTERNAPDPLEGWSISRLGYSSSLTKGIMLTPTKRPVFTILNPQKEQAAVFHVPPLLPLPVLSPGDEEPLTLSLRSYINHVFPHIHRCTPSFAPPTAFEVKNANDDDTRHGVGVVIATRSEFTMFVAEPFHQRYRFVNDKWPVQIVSDDIVLPDGTSLDERQRVLSASLATFAARVKQSPEFHSAATWWYRVDGDVVDLLRTALNDSQPLAGATSPKKFLDDCRWAMLPRTKLLKNAKWNVDPETMAEEMKYGLLEIMGGASPRILQVFDIKKQ